MKGDFSRGFNPDTKRGRSYRRVLLQQGRALLDSDLAALVDNTDQLIREAITTLACDAGSSDLGYLVTPGVLLALFDARLGVDYIANGNAAAVRDHAQKYLDRLPGLRISASNGVGTVEVKLRHSLREPSRIRIWVYAEDSLSATVNEIPFPIPGGLASYTAIELQGISGDTLRFSVEPLKPYWIALVETRVATVDAPVFHAEQGSYEVEGLTASTMGGVWPEFCYPLSDTINALFATAAEGDRFAVFLEFREHHITAVEDPGILERALGGEHDTTTRTKVVAQVKLAPVAASTTVNEVNQAFGTALNLPSGRLVVSTPPGAESSDPCDLPTPGGYTGLQNRLYRFEIHSATPSQTLVKWSRENGAELFPVKRLNNDSSLNVSPHLNIRDGDLVEILSNAIDLSDGNAASIGTELALTRPQMMVGDLVRLVDAGMVASGAERHFTFEDPLTQAPIPVLDVTRYGSEGLKLRRWSNAFVRNGVGAEKFAIEDGIEVEIAGSFEAGDWWQYEARVGGANANDPWQSAPHGPQRFFAPLAVIGRQADSEPMLLEAWLDTRFPKLCTVHADNISYDNSKTGIESNTVQEAIDELFERDPEIIEASCGEIVVRPENELQDVFDSIPRQGSAKVCLGARTYTLTESVSVTAKGHLIISGNGCGGTKLLSSDDPRTVFYFDNCESVILRDFSLESTGTFGAILLFRNCNEVIIEGISVRSRIEDGSVYHGASAIRIEATDTKTSRRVRVRNNRIEASQDEIGVLVLDMDDVKVEDNHIETQAVEFNIEVKLGEAETASRIGNILIDNVVINPEKGVHFPNDDIFDNFSDEITVISLAGIDEVDGNLVGEWNPHRIMSLGRGWGRAPIIFSTHRNITPETWQQIINANPVLDAASAPPEWIIASLRRLKAALAREMFDIDSPATIPELARASFVTLANNIARSTPLIFGRQGIVVAMKRVPKQGRDRTNKRSVTQLIGREPRRHIGVSGNRVIGFRQGIHVGASDSKRYRAKYLFATDVAVANNWIELRVPLFAPERHGIFVGHALSAAIRENRIEITQPEQSAWSTVLPPPTDGIRMWGKYGPLLHVTGNQSLGVTTGIRVHAMNSGSGASLGYSWNVSNNAYYGRGDAENIIGM